MKILYDIEHFLELFFQNNIDQRLTRRGRNMLPEKLQPAHASLMQPAKKSKPKTDDELPWYLIRKSQPTMLTENPDTTAAAEKTKATATQQHVQRRSATNEQLTKSPTRSHSCDGSEVDEDDEVRDKTYVASDSLESEDSLDLILGSEDEEEMSEPLLKAVNKKTVSKKLI